MIPIILKIKKKSHRDIAAAQDLLVQEMYAVFNYAVLHGGTAIWRCYKGNRFSEDIDVYLKRDIKKIELFFDNLQRKGFIIKKKKIGENSLFSELETGRSLVRFEALFKHKDGILKEYEAVDGNLITVYTLSPEELLNEKTEAYLKRLKIRDLYDVFFLLRHVQNKNRIKDKVQMLIKRFTKPQDEGELKVLILEGLVPDAEKMIAYIEHYL